MNTTKKKSREDLIGDFRPRRPREDLVGDIRVSRSSEPAPTGEDDPDDMLFDANNMPRPENGATATWFMDALGISRRTVMSRLVTLKPLRIGSRGAPVYALQEALPLLVPAQIDDEKLAEKIKRMRPQDIPPLLHAVFWDGQNKKTTWMKNARELWTSEEVLDVLADTFKVVQSTTMLWADEMEIAKGITDEQMEWLREQVDALQDVIYAKLVDMQSEKQTVPIADKPIGYDAEDQS